MSKRQNENRTKEENVKELNDYLSRFTSGYEATSDRTYIRVTTKIDGSIIQYISGVVIDGIQVLGYKITGVCSEDGRPYLEVVKKY